MALAFNRPRSVVTKWITPVFFFMIAKFMVKVNELSVMLGGVKYVFLIDAFAADTVSTRPDEISEVKSVK